MINLVQILICLLFQYSCVVHDHMQRKDDSATIHYLGHSCFYIDFCGAVAVLKDYGKPDAYKEYGCYICASISQHCLTHLHGKYQIYIHRN